MALRVTDVVENTSLFLMGLQAQQRKRVCYVVVYNEVVYVFLF